MKIYEYILRIKDQASDKARRIANAFSSSKKPIDRFSEGMKDASNSTGMLSGVTSSLLRWLGPAALGAALLAGSLNASKLAREMEQTSISFEVMIGSAKQARGMLNELTDLANVTPFTRTEVQDSAKLLLNFGVSAKKILPTVKMLGDISGGNAYKLHLMSLAFAQMSAAGRLMGQDLLQMVNAGFNPLQEISRKTGISLVKLKKAMEDGAISSKLVEEAFKIGHQ
jgi:tape measure domain-containing protein